MTFIISCPMWKDDQETCINRPYHQKMSYQNNPPSASKQWNKRIYIPLSKNTRCCPYTQKKKSNERERERESLNAIVMRCDLFLSVIINCHSRLLIHATSSNSSSYIKKILGTKCYGGYYPSILQASTKVNHTFKAFIHNIEFFSWWVKYVLTSLAIL